jgi:hypothetical protein
VAARSAVVVVVVVCPRPVKERRERRPAQGRSGAARRVVAAGVWLRPRAAAVRLRPQAAAEAVPFSPALLLFPSPALFPAPAAAWRAQREASAAQAGALPPGEWAEWDVAVVLLPAAAHAAVLQQAAGRAAAQQRAVAAARDVAAAVAAEQDAAVVEVAAPDVAEVEVAEQAAEVRRPEARGAAAALPSAAAWAFRRDPAPHGPARRPAARSARAMEQRPVAAR